MSTGNSTARRSNFKDIAGQQFGDLTAVSYAGSSLGSQAGAYWLFRCKCGTEKVLNGRAVRSGNVISCGCSKQRTDETGNVYSKLTVLEFAGQTNSGDSRWLCECECGKTTTVARADLKRESIKSCGCHRASAGGMCNSPEHTSWREMKRRCDSDYKDKHLYWERGITICEKWRSSFNAFFADMGPKPFPEATIDRIDNDGNYEPGNCRWATKLEQGQNTRKARLLTYNRETHGLREWARRLGVAHRTIARRLDEQKWTMEQVVKHYTSPG